MPPRDWPDGEEEYLIALYPTKTIREISVDLGKSFSAVKNRIQKLKLKKQDAELEPLLNFDEIETLAFCRPWR